jgi:predicted nucleic acid-binding protein
MTLVVADSSPIRYLLIIDAIELLPALYGRVIVPEYVQTELSHPHAPAEARAWASSLPSWAEVRTAKRIELAGILDPGEAEAIALSEELKADVVLLDDRAARRRASERVFGLREPSVCLSKLPRRGSWISPKRFLNSRPPISESILFLCPLRLSLGERAVARPPVVSFLHEQLPVRDARGIADKCRDWKLLRRAGHCEQLQAGLMRQAVALLCVHGFV